MIKDHIITNFKEDSLPSLLKSIDDSINDGDEILLPGLGVFLALYWENSSSDEKKAFCKNLKTALEKY